MKKLFLSCFLMVFTFCCLLAVGQYESTDFGYVRFDEVSKLPRAIFNINESSYSGDPTQIAESYIDDNSTKLFNNTKPELLLYREIKDSPAGAKITFQQHFKGIPVAGAFITVSIDKSGTVTSLYNEYIPEINISTTPSIPASKASSIAEETYSKDATLIISTENLVIISDGTTPLLAWRIYIRTEEYGSHVLYLDASNGVVLRTNSAEIEFGYVFNPDPSTRLGEFIPDYNDADHPIFADCYIDVELPNLDPPVDGLYKLRGTYAYSDDICAPYDPITYETTNEFYYNRSQNGFEEVNVYYFVDKEVTKVRELGYIPLWDVDPALQSSYPPEALAFDARGGTNQHASFNYNGEEKYIRFGVPSNATDLAEDMSVIYHEFGHALHDAMIPGGFVSSPDWISSEFLRFAEGFADYYAISRRREAVEHFGLDYFDPNSVSNFAMPQYRYSVFPPEVADFTSNWWDNPNFGYYKKGAAFCSSLMDLEYIVSTDPSQGRRLDQEVVTTLALATFQSIGVSLNIEDFVLSMIDNDFNIYGGIHVATIVEVFSNRNAISAHVLTENMSANHYLSGIVLVDLDVNIIDATIEIASHTKVLLNGTLRVEQGSVLNIGYKSEVYFMDRGALLVVEEGSSVTLSESSKVIGKFSTIHRDPPFIPEEIPGNKFVVYGELNIEQSVEFTTGLLNLTYPPDSDFYWDGLELYNNTNEVVRFDDTIFNNCDLYSERRAIEIYDSVFENSSIKTVLANITIEDSDINGYISSKGSIFSNTGDPGVIFNVSGCNIKGYHSGISLNGNHTYTISHSGITHNGADGISVSESRKPGSSINNCYIHNNNGAGVRFYSSVGDLNSNNIGNNDRGVTILRNSIVEMKKVGYDNQIISNNNWENISFLDDCTVSLATNKNKIINPGTYNVICPNLSTIRDFNFNMWDINGYPDTNLFYPPILDPSPNEIGYVILETWLGDPNTKPEGVIKQVFNQGVSALLIEDYDIAEIKFKEIIEEYPESQYLYGSTKNLLLFEEDYDELKSYFATIGNSSPSEQISNHVDYLEYNCDLLSGDIDAAVDYLENIIENPVSEIDSLMAYIDLMNVSFLIEDSNFVRNLSSNNINHKLTHSIVELESLRNNLVDNMLNHNMADNMQDTNVEPIVKAKLIGNYPNPFNPETTISFNLSTQGMVKISIYNLKGQKVKTLINDNRKAGMHSILWNGKDANEREVASGVYLYNLLVNGKHADVQKCILMK